MSLTLRPADEADTGLVLHYIRALAEYEKLLHEVTATEVDLHRLLTGPRPLAEALIAEWEGKPVGFALWFYAVSTFNALPSLYVEDVFVEPEQRGRGIGRAIFAHLAAHALGRGCGRMEWSVLDWNAPSIAFYRSIGARPREGWTLQQLSGPALSALAARES
ncbi:GNAT family N-acetyltransferase [Paeniroseomonas aquatica]|uniref:GNAT family N-acetyltransferase n=1 Tax=Paeniroseomonas aquatica TaxID=373043 RepID=A0ABT8ADX3_9PROT|nr:GNAT family N-acetyltransferase [Paeniroseomonas aquatica]MDN3567939.1 GNAT family N-acetyltransferase [Paeniroseomonas aquatica]